MLTVTTIQDLSQLSLSVQQAAEAYTSAVAAASDAGITVTTNLMYAPMENGGMMHSGPGAKVLGVSASCTYPL